MIVVDNFRTVLLVGLICTFWISPSFAAMCAGKADACADTDKYCFIDENAKEAGCKADGCPDGSDAAFTCKEGKCCCLATDTPCNTWATVKDEACKDATLAALDACKMGPAVTDGTVSSSVGPTGGADTPPPPAGGLMCKLNDTVTTSCSAGKACKANKDRSEVKCVEASECNEDGCTDDGCCCKMAADATTVCEIPSSGSVIFGSLQVVTLVAAALYFFPVKTSS